MKVAGVSIVLLLGIVNFLLILFQVSTGLRWMKVPIGIHKKTGLTLLLSATLHGLLAILTS